MNSKTLAILIAALLMPLHATAQSSAKQQYISDDISVTMRERPSNDASPVGSLHSGMPVSVLEVLGADSFARVRTADGREGWITARYISDQPAAKDQTIKLRQQLQEAEGQIQGLQRDLQTAQQQVAKARPALEMAADNEKLRETVAERERTVSEMESRFDLETAHRKTLATGAIIGGAGLLCGLLLPMLVSGSRQRRYRDLV